MLIKSADNKDTDLETLRQLQSHPAASPDTKKRIDQELRFMLSGIKGEREAAYEIEFHYGQSKNWAVLHDVRIEHKGRVAQIDHLLINRFLEVWVCESKRFSEGMAINEHGECAAFYGGKPYGMPSPFEQNKKHCAVLKQALLDGAAALPRRLGFAIKPDIKSMILISKNARITRPKAKIDGLEDILKVDQIKARIDKSFDNDPNILQAAKVIGSDTLEDFAKRVAGLHVPARFNWHAKFGLAQGAEPTLPTSGDGATKSATAPAPAAAAADGVQEEARAYTAPQSKLACASCPTVVAYAVAKFCWLNKARFGGRVYCRECQKKVAAAT